MGQSSGLLALKAAAVARAFTVLWGLVRQAWVFWELLLPGLSGILGWGWGRQTDIETWVGER